MASWASYIYPAFSSFRTSNGCLFSFGGKRCEKCCAVRRQAFCHRQMIAAHLCGALLPTAKENAQTHGAAKLRSKARNEAYAAKLRSKARNKAYAAKLRSKARNEAYAAKLRSKARNEAYAAKLRSIPLISTKLSSGNSPFPELFCLFSCDLFAFSIVF